MIVHRKVINTNKAFRIRPFGDLQKGATGFQRGLWERWKREAIADKDSWILGLGDYSDSFRPTIEKRLKGVFVDDHEAHSQLDAMIDRTTDQLAEELEPLKDRIIGLLEGHHFHTNVQGITSTQILCQKLGVKYMTKTAAIQLIVRGITGYTLDIFATHGEGGATRASSDLRNHELKTIPIWDVDLYIRGHSTQVYALPSNPLSRISMNRGNGKPFIQERQRWIVNTGGFMSAYLPDTSSYVEDKQLPKVALGWAVVEITPKGHNAGQNRFEISTSTYVPSQ